MKQTMKMFVVMVVMLLLLSTTTMLVTAKKGPGLGDGRGGPKEDPDDPSTIDKGDLYGDLVVVDRETMNGIPVVDETTGCEYYIDSYNGEAVLMDYDEDSGSCVIPEGANTTEVGFGRLNIVRSPPRVLESAFDEAINGLNGALNISLDDAGRFFLQKTAVDVDGVEYTYWKQIDSSRENLALYKKIMLDGHLEGNLGNYTHLNMGDPTAEQILRPTLNVTHFNAVVDPNIDLSHLLNTSGDPQDLPLTQADFMTTASLFAAGADKTGHVTIDKIFYINSIFGLNVQDEDGTYVEYVNFSGMNYARDGVYNKEVYVLVPELNETGSWIFGHWVQDYVWLMNETEYPEGILGSNPDVFNWDKPGVPLGTEYIVGFTQASDDALRVIAYTHDNKMPPAPVE